MIEFVDIRAGYDGTPILNGCTAKIEAGEFVCLEGPSGSGKSTLFKVLYRDIDLYEGEVLLDGRSTSQMPRYQVRRMLGVIFQSFELLERKTALENVALAGAVLGRPERMVREQSLALLEKVGLQGKENRVPMQLSGGEQQRVAIARALLSGPKILLADEPTGNLDEKNAVNVMELLKGLQRDDGLTVLVISHSRDLVRSFGSRFLAIADGKVFEA